MRTAAWAARSRSRAGGQAREPAQPLRSWDGFPRQLRGHATCHNASRQSDATALAPSRQRKQQVAIELDERQWGVLLQLRGASTT